MMATMYYVYTYSGITKLITTIIIMHRFRKWHAIHWPNIA